MKVMSSQYVDARKIVAKGLDIYERKYRVELERQHNGAFAAIDINNEAVYLADLPENALSEARARSPDGVFYLMRVGWPAAFKSSRMTATAVPKALSADILSLRDGSLSIQTGPLTASALVMPPPR
jgi:hypothetical protein